LEVICCCDTAPASWQPSQPPVLLRAVPLTLTLTRLVQTTFSAAPPPLEELDELLLLDELEELLEEDELELLLELEEDEELELLLLELDDELELPPKFILALLMVAPMLINEVPTHKGKLGALALV
jgi:hypothetical protein